jgi:DNA-directed RNA polymerase specialized sigma subunit
MAGNYCDNDKLLTLLNDFKILKEERLETGLPKPRVPDSIGVEIINIAENLATRFNFKKYTYIDDMVADGILAALKAVDFFDPERGKPFTFLNFIIWRAFVNRIRKENKEHTFKESMMSNINIASFSTQEDDRNETFFDSSETAIWYENN